MFQCSVSTRNVRCAQYLGGGGSKGFLKTCKSKVYGKDLIVEKPECIGYDQKRMRTRLRIFRYELKSIKLSDEKKISGRGRLTDAEIVLIQKYY